MDEFKVGEAALIIKGDYVGRECTITAPLDLYDGIETQTRQFVMILAYGIEIEGVAHPRPGCRLVIPPHCLKRKEPPKEKEPCGEWELCPWQPKQEVVR